MNRSWNVWLMALFALIVLMAGLASEPVDSWAQTTPPTPTETPQPELPAIHPLYGNCEEGENGTVPAPAPTFEPFLPNSIYVDWCGHAILTLAQPSAGAASAPPASTGFDPAVGHRIGLMYSTDITDTGWSISQYSYRVDYSEQELAVRTTALLREICPLGNPCNEILVAQVGKLGTEFTLVNATGSRKIAQPDRKVFVPYVSNAD